jgi:hypothetical protein
MSAGIVTQNGSLTGPPWLFPEGIKVSFMVTSPDTNQSNLSNVAGYHIA